MLWELLCRQIVLGELALTPSRGLRPRHRQKENGEWMSPASIDLPAAEP